MLSSSAWMALGGMRFARLQPHTLILLTSDHGGHERKHGTRHPLDMTIFWGCRGPGIARGSELEARVSIMDTAAVVAQALGLARPSAWEAAVPKGWSNTERPVPTTLR